MTVHFYFGDGSALNPFVIKGDSTATVQEQLQYLNDADYVDKGYYFILGEDVDLTGVTWTTIGGTSGSEFVGTLDGNGYTLSNIASTFISMTSNGVVKNIKIKTTQYSGTSCYYIILSGSIYNCEIDFNNSAYSGSGSYSILGCISNVENAVNCIFKNITISGVTEPYIIFGKSSSSQIKNIFAYNLKLSGGSGPNTNVMPVHYWNSPIVSDFITIDGYRNNTYSTTFKCYRVSGHAPTNAYASDTITSNVGTYDAGSTTSENGLTVSSSLYNTKEFYDGTGISGTIYLSWDFDDIWEWDSTTNLPKLRMVHKEYSAEVYKYNGTSWDKTGTMEYDI